MRTGALRLPPALALAAALGVPSAAQVVQEHTIANGQGGLESTLAAGCRFGWDVGPVGDVDGDGTTDIAVGVPLDDDGGSARGAVYVLFLNPDGTVKAEQKISATAGGFVGPLQGNAFLGSAVAGLGDLDGDTVPDLAVGADGDSANGFRRGAVWILFLNPDGTVKAEQRICGTTGGFTGTLDDQDRFGSALARLDDLDGDGNPELAVGANLDDDGALNAGAVWILFLNQNGTVAQHQKISRGNGGLTGANPGAGDRFGSALASMNDFDGDGNDDLAVGTPLDDDGIQDNGAVWVLFLNPDGTVAQQQKISETQGSGGFGLDRDQFGSGIAMLGDLDGDGNDDMAVGALSSTLQNNVHPGGVWILFLTPLGTVREGYIIMADVAGMQGPIVSGDQFGCAVGRIDDIDGNGVDDLVIGSWGKDSFNGFDVGGVWVVGLAVPVEARADLRNDAMGINQNSLEVLPIPAQNNLYYTGAGPYVGGTTFIRIGLAGLAHDMGILFAFDTPAEVPVGIGGGGVLLCLDGGGSGEILSGAGLAANAIGSGGGKRLQYVIDLPNDGSIAGIAFTAQAIIFGNGATPALTNAADIVIGVL